MKLLLVPSMVADHLDMDEEHEALLEQMEATYAGLDRRDLSSALVRAYAFEQALRRHFEHETQLMAKCRYPGIDAHVAAHIDTLRRVSEFLAYMQAHADPAPGRRGAVAIYLMDMLAGIGADIGDHMLRQDTALGRFLSDYARDA